MEVILRVFIQGVHFDAVCHDFICIIEDKYLVNSYKERLERLLNMSLPIEFTLEVTSEGTDEHSMVYFNEDTIGITTNTERVDFGEQTVMFDDDYPVSLTFNN